VRSWLDVDLGAVVSNARALDAYCAPAALCAVVKSDAYGHGLVPVARALSGAGIDRLHLAVFGTEEAFALREAGIRGPLLVLGPVDDGDLEEAGRARIEIAVLAEEDVRRFAPHRLSVHVKIDTGVSRFGVVPDAGPRVIAACADAGLTVAGVYSHLANAEDLDVRFTMEQLYRLRRAAGATPHKMHIAASAAAILWSETRLDMVRCGIAIYGRWPSDGVAVAASGVLELRPALRWFAPIAGVRDIAAGQSVGYGCEFKPQRDSVIAVLPVGYADGLGRAAGGGRLALRLAGGTAPIVGRICMNACMIDVTDLRTRPIRGDIAEIDIEDAARAAGTIDYEILARLPPSLERRYG
jgi:alanine racemase